MPLFASVKDKLSRSSSSSKSEKKQPFAASSSSSTTARSNPYHTPGASTGPAPALNPASQDAPPPAYTPTAAPLTAAGATSDNDPYAFLSKFDTIILVDDSGSMAGNLWTEATTALRQITSICTAHDKDGIDLYFLNHSSGDSRPPEGKGTKGYYNVSDPQVVDAIFNRVRPYGRTFTGTRIEDILKPYIQQLSRSRDHSAVRPVNLIVITDGCPNDDPESVIVQHARKLDQMDAPLYQVGIQFFQIGKDREATEALRDLDDGLAEQGVRDMVDTATFDAQDPNSNKVLTADGILKVVLGAVVRRLDRKPADGQRRRR